MAGAEPFCVVSCRAGHHGSCWAMLCRAELVTNSPLPGRAWAEPKSPYFELAHLGFVWQGLNNSRPTLLPGLDLIVPGVSLKPCDKQIQSVIKTARKKFVRLFQLFRKQYTLDNKTVH
jgi:hypothetical protein